jgi:hypothetical protein
MADRISGEGVSVNAIHAGSTDANPERWMVTQVMLEREIRKVKKARAEHAGERSGQKRRRIGFQGSERLPLQRRQGTEEASGTIKGH